MFSRTARLAPEKAVFRPALPLRSLPGANGTHMSKMKYADQLLSPKWQKLRLEVMQAADWKCERCGDAETTLHVHHPEYRRGAMAWEYEPNELQCLCSNCHDAEHGKPVPEGSRSAKRSIWEVLATFHVQACVYATCHPGMSPSDVEALAKRLCAAEGIDYDALEAKLYSA